MGAGGVNNQAQEQKARTVRNGRDAPALVILCFPRPSSSSRMVRVLHKWHSMRISGCFLLPWAWGRIRCSDTLPSRGHSSALAGSRAGDVLAHDRELCSFSTVQSTSAGHQSLYPLLAEHFVQGTGRPLKLRSHSAVRLRALISPY